MRLRPRSRPAGTLVEFAIIAPVAFLLLIGLLVGGLGVFRYQQIAYLAREASRWASVHGAKYASDTQNSAATATDVYNNAIKPNAAGLDISQLTYTVTWSTSNSQYHSGTVNGNTVNVANTVTVTINYKWIPEAYLPAGTMTTTSVSPMSY